MIMPKTLLNFGAFIILLIRPQVHAVMLNYEEPFPPRLPVQVKSRVAFTQYANVPMLSLEEIKSGFPWLKMSAESEADRESRQRSTESGPRYIFYYVPKEVDPNSQKSTKSHPGYDDGKPEPERRNSIRDKSRNHRYEVKSINKPTQSHKELQSKKTKQISRNKKAKEKLADLITEPSEIESDDFLVEKRRYHRHKDRDDEDKKKTKSEYKIKAKKDRASLALPKNHKFGGRDPMAQSNFPKVVETRTLPDYLYPKTPSRYMQPPQMRFEEKEYWVKNKRKSKRPNEESARNEDRLKNHRFAKHKKSKTVHPDNEKRLKNHKPTYDREHDPDERAQSSSGKVERLRKRPKEVPKNPLLLSQNGDRLQFHVHGHEGPETYIFGYDTGDGENRHFRLEERLRDGSVKGHYGYYDSNGKLKMVEYKSRPMGGYEEKHHASGNLHESDQEDNGKTES